MVEYKEEKVEAIYNESAAKRNLRTWIACMWSFLVSMTGGLLFGWWEYQYHPTNSQLWMVPFGLILLATPVIVWFSVFVSDICNYCSREEDNDHGDSMQSQRVDHMHDSV